MVAWKRARASSSVAAALLILVTIAQPSEGQGSGLSADLTTPVPLALEGRIAWGGSGSAVASFDADGFEAQTTGVTVHVWRWNQTSIDLGVIRHESALAFEPKEIHLPGPVTIKAAGSEASGTIGLLAGRITGNTTAATTQRLAEAHASVDPLYRARTPVDGVPYVHHAWDVPVLSLQDGGALHAEGALVLAFWEATISVATDDHAATFRSGEWLEQQPSATASTHIKQVVWLHITSGSLDARLPPGATVFAGALDVVTTGSVSATTADGYVSAPGGNAQAKAQTIDLRGQIRVLSHPGSGSSTSESGIDDPTSPYSRSRWMITGNAEYVMVGNTILQMMTGTLPEAPTLVAGATALGIAWLLFRLAPIVLSTSTKTAGGRRTSARVFDAVATQPGLNAQELARGLGLSPSTVKYHLRRLTSDGTLVADKDGRTLRYCVNHEIWVRNSPIVMALRHNGCARLVDVIIESPGLGQADLARDTGLPRSTVSFHLRRLLKTEALRTERLAGRNMKTYHPTQRLHGILSRLRHATPTNTPQLTAEA